MSFPFLAANLADVRARMAAACARAGRDATSVKLVAVSKYRPVEHTRALYDLGVRDFGENRVQEGRDKIPVLPHDIAWHLIGPLQTNKAKYLPGLFAWVHSVERVEVADALEKAYAKSGERVRILIQVNIAGEEQKSGCTPADAEALVRAAAAMPHLDVRGLMAMAPFVDDPELARPVFRGLRELAITLREATGLALPELSMGMTGDFEVAIEEGATIVRVGTALYQEPDAR